MKFTINELKKIIHDLVFEARIYGDPYRTSDEYDLTPQEIDAIKNMDHGQRMKFALKKLKDARRMKGQCISGGPKCEIPPIDPETGKPGPYCKKHLEQFRAARQKLTKARGSCSRCPNPPLPGKKLCQKCTDEIQAIRDKAVSAGLCMRCKKAPAVPPTKFCIPCMKAKVERNKQIKNRRKGWQDYAKDVDAVAVADRLKTQGIKPKQEESIQKKSYYWRFGKTDNLQHATPTESKYVKALCGTWHPNTATGWTTAHPTDCIYPKCPKCQEIVAQLSGLKESLIHGFVTPDEIKLLEYLRRKGFSRNKLSDLDRWYFDKNKVHYTVRKTETGTWSFLRASPRMYGKIELLTTDLRYLVLLKKSYRS